MGFSRGWTWCWLAVLCKGLIGRNEESSFGAFGSISSFDLSKSGIDMSGHEKDLEIACDPPEASKFRI